VAARLPHLAAAYLAELRERPNRFIGLCSTTRDDGWAEAEAAERIETGLGYAETLVLTVLGRRIERTERRVIDAALVSGAEYGETAASSAMARLIGASSAPPLDAYRAMIATFGYYHLGALKASAMIIEAAADGDIKAVIAASTRVDQAESDRPARGRVAGFGHRFQTRDPRAALLLEMCLRRLPGRYIAAAAALNELLSGSRVGHINMDGIGAAMGLQVGFPARITSLLTLVARAPGVAKEYAKGTAAPGRYALKQRGGLR
jgi:citrate synthase